jgi:putative FmdB family regulatory protein
MPIYEYICNACGNEFEEWQKISDAPVRKCPRCGKRKVERLVSLSTFHLKGSGWYVTDYAGKKPGRTDRETKADTASDKSSDKSSGKSSDKGSSDTKKST